MEISSCVFLAPQNQSFLDKILRQSSSKITTMFVTHAKFPDSHFPWVSGGSQRPIVGKTKVAIRD